MGIDSDITFSGQCFLFFLNGIQIIATDFEHVCWKTHLFIETPNVKPVLPEATAMFQVADRWCGATFPLWIFDTGARQSLLKLETQG